MFLHIGKIGFGLRLTCLNHLNKGVSYKNVVHHGRRGTRRKINYATTQEQSFLSHRPGRVDLLVSQRGVWLARCVEKATIRRRVLGCVQNYGVFLAHVSESNMTLCDGG